MNPAPFLLRFRRSMLGAVITDLVEIRRLRAVDAPLVQSPVNPIVGVNKIGFVRIRNGGIELASTATLI